MSSLLTGVRISVRGVPSMRAQAANSHSETPVSAVAHANDFIRSGSTLGELHPLEDRNAPRSSSRSRGAEGDAAERHVDLAFGFGLALELKLQADERIGRDGSVRGAAAEGRP